MRQSSIAKHLSCGPDSALARSIGLELKRRRIAAGLSQGQVGRPLSRAFVSAVEHGHVVPSLPSLLLLAGRLGTDAAALLNAVKMDSTAVYNLAHGSPDQAASSRGRRRSAAGGRNRVPNPRGTDPRGPHTAGAGG